MRYRIKVPGSANFIPKMLFLNEWEVHMHISAILGYRDIPGIEIEPYAEG